MLHEVFCHVFCENNVGPKIEHWGTPLIGLKKLHHIAEDCSLLAFQQCNIKACNMFQQTGLHGLSELAKEFVFGNIIYGIYHFLVFLTLLKQVLHIGGIFPKLNVVIFLSRSFWVSHSIFISE